jgi:hypothetical protein
MSVTLSIFSLVLAPASVGIAHDDPSGLPEPLLGGNIIFSEPFAGDDWFRRNGWSGLVLPNYLRVVSDPAGRPGNRVLRWTIPRGLHSIGSFYQAINREEAWIGYQLYLPADFGQWDLGDDQADICKFPGFDGGGTENGGQRKTTGYNGWSVRMGWNVDRQDRVSLGFYCYHIDMPFDYGDWVGWNTGPIQRGRWHSLWMRMRVNTIGANGANADGFVEGWFNGRRVARRDRMRFSHVAAYRRIESLWMNYYFGGNRQAPKDLTIFVDDVRIGLPHQ